MKKSLTLAAAISLALSGIANADDILDGDPGRSATQLAEVTENQADGDAPHNADQHQESGDALDDALEILEGGDDAPMTPIMEPGERVPCG
jgi:hypothetical protein